MMALADGTCHTYIGTYDRVSFMCTWRCSLLSRVRLTPLPCQLLLIFSIYHLMDMFICPLELIPHRHIGYFPQSNSLSLSL